MEIARIMRRRALPSRGVVVSRIRSCSGEIDRRRSSRQICLIDLALGTVPAEERLRLRGFFHAPRRELRHRATPRRDGDPSDRPIDRSLDRIVRFCQRLASLQGFAFRFSSARPESRFLSSSSFFFTRDVARV